MVVLFEAERESEARIARGDGEALPGHRSCGGGESGEEAERDEPATAKEVVTERGTGKAGGALQGRGGAAADQDPVLGAGRNVASIGLAGCECGLSICRGGP